MSFRHPSTIADIEVIAAEGVFEAVVTFESEFLVQANIEECVAGAGVFLLSGVGAWPPPDGVG
jgi:hypothetical protein